MCVVTSTTALPESSPTFFIRRSPPPLPSFPSRFFYNFALLQVGNQVMQRAMVGEISGGWW